MERKRKAGRFVREDGVDDGVKQETKAAVGAPRPRNCRTFTRKRVAEALPKIVEAFAEEAKKGSVAHMKMLANLGGLDKRELPVVKKRRGKSAVRRLLEMTKDAE
ncbi:MAG TPA: hypothetical protein VIX42_07950 [Edaphobacter sp.]